MKTYLPLILCAMLMIGSCGKDEQPVPEPEDPVIVAEADTFPDNFEGHIVLTMAKDIYEDSATLYSLRAYVYVPGSGFLDPGSVSYNDIQLPRMTSPFDTFFLSPLIPTPIEQGKKWRIPDNRMFHAVVLPDKLSFPEATHIPDTLQKSLPYSVSFNSAEKARIWIDLPPLNASVNEDIFLSQNQPGNNFTFELTESQKSLLGDSVYIHVTAERSIEEPTGIFYFKETRTHKWVKVVE